MCAVLLCVAGAMQISNMSGSQQQQFMPQQMGVSAAPGQGVPGSGPSGLMQQPVQQLHPPTCQPLQQPMNPFDQQQSTPRHAHHQQQPQQDVNMHNQQGMQQQQQPMQVSMHGPSDIKMEHVKIELGVSGGMLGDCNALPPELALLNDPDFGGGGAGLQPLQPTLTGTDALLAADNSELAAAFNEMYNGPGGSALMISGDGDGGLGLGDHKDDDLFNFFS